MLSQIEAEALLRMPKRFVARPAFLALDAGCKQRHELIADNREEFVLDLWRGSIRLSKCTLQTRARVIYPLARLDIDGAPHTNPDGTRLEGTHLHVCRDGSDRWAVAPDPTLFPGFDDRAAVLQDFCRFCAIEALPVQASLP